jgi:hypothetical protein
VVVLLHEEDLLAATRIGALEETMPAIMVVAIALITIVTNMTNKEVKSSAVPTKECVIVFMCVHTSQGPGRGCRLMI